VVAEDVGKIISIQWSKSYRVRVLSIVELVVVVVVAEDLVKNVGVELRPTIAQLHRYLNQFHGKRNSGFEYI